MLVKGMEKKAPTTGITSCWAGQGDLDGRGYGLEGVA